VSTGLHKTKTLPSITNILKKISDDKALILFSRIAISGENACIPLKEMNLSTKQYYSRISGLIDAGLVRRSHGKYYLTPIGNVVNEAHMMIGKALSYYWRIKIIESVQYSSDGISKEDLSKLITILIDNHEIKDILLKATGGSDYMPVVDNKGPNDLSINLRKVVAKNNIKKTQSSEGDIMISEIANMLQQELTS
jgi:hypothetical protein